jgi:acyl dehydratase
MSLFYEDQKVGDARALGAHTFTRESIIAFALLYDPQPFHLSEEAGKASIYGALIASGWHTASVCMRLLIDWRDRSRAERAALGEPLPRPGLSPGFRDMRWLAPVRAGDTIAYSTRVESLRESKRSQWGVVTSRNIGLDQHGAEVFAFTSAVLWERRPV